MNGLFGNFSMMNPQGGQGQLSGFGRGVGGYQMPMNVQVPQQDLSTYFNKPMISQQKYVDWLRNERPLQYMIKIGPQEFMTQLLEEAFPNYRTVHMDGSPRETPL